MLVSSLSFSIMQVFVKLSSEEVGTFEQTFFRNLVSLIIAAVMVRRETCRFSGDQTRRLGALGKVVLRLSGDRALLLCGRSRPPSGCSYAEPGISGICHTARRYFLKEKITPVKIASTILCLVGAYIAMQPSFDSNPFPLLAALLAAVVSGMAYTMLSYCKNFTHPSAIIFHFSALSTVCAGLMMLPNLVIPSPKVFVMLLLIGVFAAGGQFFLTYAYQQAPASEVSIYQYSGVVFTAVFSYAFLGETLGKSSIIGGIVILGAIFWVFENTRKEKNT